MRDDLLDAQATLDWAKSNFPAFQSLLGEWIANNISVAIRETNANASHDLVIATEKKPLPFSFSVAAGAYINVIRSALDILAVALGKRYGITNPKNVYFPVVDNAAIFQGMRFKGAELVKRMPPADRKIIEALKPYRGGNDALHALHHLDITRKHHRLLSVSAVPARLSLTGGFEQADIVFPGERGYVEIPAQGETVLALIRKPAKAQAQYSAEIFIQEPDIAFHKPAVGALHQFADIADAIIKSFDAP